MTFTKCSHFQTHSVPFKYTRRKSQTHECCDGGKIVIDVQLVVKWDGRSLQLTTYLNLTEFLFHRKSKLENNCTSLELNTIAAYNYVDTFTTTAILK